MKKLSLIGMCLGICLNICQAQQPNILADHFPGATSGQRTLSPQKAASAKQWHPVSPSISVHRGGRFLAGYPENAIETFQYISQQLPFPPLIIECDVNMSSDSVLFLLHDQTLDRTTTGKGIARQTDWASIKRYNLKDDYGIVTRYKPPPLDHVLDWAFREVQLSLDIKLGVPVSKVVKMIREHEALSYVSVITYNYQDALEAYLTDPKIRLSVNIRNEEELERYLNGPFRKENLMAFTGLTERSPSLYKKIKCSGMKVIVGTIGNLDKRAAVKGHYIYSNLYKAGADILATDRPIAVYNALLDQMTALREN